MDRVMTAKRGGAPVIDPEREAALAARRARRERQRAMVTDVAAGAATTPRSAPTWPPTSTVPDAAVLRHPGGQGHPAGRLRGAARRAGHVPRPVGPARRPRRQRPVLRGTGRDRGPAAAALLAGPARRRPGARGGRRVRLLPGVLRGQRPGGARRERHRRAGPVHLPPPAPGAAAVPGRLLQAPGRRRARRGRRCSWSPSASRSASTRRSCSPATSTATTWRCTACPCSSPRRWPSTGTGASAPSWPCPTAVTLAARRPGGPGRHPAQRLPGLPVRVRLPGLPRPGGPGEDRRPARRGPDRGASCPRSSSWCRSSPPTRSSSTTPTPTTSTPSNAAQVP